MGRRDSFIAGQPKRGYSIGREALHVSSNRVREKAPGKSVAYGMNLGSFLRSANDQVMVIVQVETTQASENIDEILEVKGVDVAFVGPSDLTMSLGLINDRVNPRVVDSLNKVVKAGQAHGKIPGVMVAYAEEVKGAAERGFKFVWLGSDRKYLISGAKSFLGSAWKA